MELAPAREPARDQLSLGEVRGEGPHEAIAARADRRPHVLLFRVDAAEISSDRMRLNGGLRKSHPFLTLRSNAGGMLRPVNSGGVTSERRLRGRRARLTRGLGTFGLGQAAHDLATTSGWLMVLTAAASIEPEAPPSG